MELFKSAMKTYGFFILLKCEIQKYWYFARRVQKMLRHTDGVMQNAYKNIWFFDTVEIMKSKNIEKHKAKAIRHRWRQTSVMKSELTCTF